MAHLLKNFCSAILANDVIIGNSQITVGVGHNLPTSVGTFVLVIWNETSYPSPADDSGMEIVIAQYSGTPNVYDVVRAQESTVESAHSVGDKAALHLTAGVLGGYLASGANHSELASIGADDHHNQSHILNGVDHTVSGLTIGHVLQALSADTFGFGAVSGLVDHGGINGLGDDDHTQYLLVDGTRAMAGNITMPDDAWVGNGASNPRIVFDNGGFLVTKNSDFYIHKEASAGVFGAQVASNVASNGFYHNTYRSRGTIASPTTVANNDALYTFNISGHDGGAWRTFGNFKFEVDGAVSSGTLPIRLIFSTGSTAIAERLRITSAGRIGINAVASPLAQVHIDQSSATGAIPVLLLDQADVSEEFIRLVGAAAAGDVTRNIVDDGDVTTRTLVGWAKVYAVDEGNQIADGPYHVPLYTLT